MHPCGPPSTVSVRLTFRSYYLLDGGPDVLITISRFDTGINWPRILNSQELQTVTT